MQQPTERHARLLQNQLVPPPPRVRPPQTNMVVDPRRRLTIAADVAAGMYYLHSSRPPIVHRDLKYVSRGGPTHPFLLPSLHLLVHPSGVTQTYHGLHTINGERAAY
eukprot:34517-Chlamydomonas_euryale.AAC.5